MVAETPTQDPPVPPGSVGSSQSPPEEPKGGPRVVLHLKGEVNPRLCSWPHNDFRALADLDHAVGGLSNLDVALLRHFAAILWVCSARDLSFAEFQERLPSSLDFIDRARRGAVILWQQIM